MQWLEDRCQAQLQRAEAECLRRSRSVLSFQSATRLTQNGQSFLQFSSNDYLGLATAALDISLHSGAGASPLVSGYSEHHAHFESAMAQYLGFESALYFNSGFSANESVLRTCLNAKDVVFADKLNHASLIDGVRYSGAKSIRYVHLDMSMLEQRLRETEVPQGGRRWIVTDAVFSMDGHIAPLKEILALAEAYDAAIFVDDAHGFGVFGEGRGTISGLEIEPSKIDVLMVTCGKSLGVSGACILGKQVLIDYLVQECRAYIYSTAVPPFVLQACSARLEHLIHATEARRNLERLGSYLYGRLSELKSLFGYEIKDAEQIMHGFHHPVQPFIIGDAETVMELNTYLFSQGLVVGAIRPPTVPQGTARLRISLTAEHTIEDIDILIDAISEFFHFRTAS